MDMPNFIYDLINYNLKNETIVNMKDFGILDPLKVVRNALINSNSVAGTLITTSGKVYEKRDNKVEDTQTY